MCVSSVECSSAVIVTVDVEMHHIALSSDELTLSVCGTGDTAELTLDFYDVRTFLNKVIQFSVLLHLSVSLDCLVFGLF